MMEKSCKPIKEAVLLFLGFLALSIHLMLFVFALTSIPFAITVFEERGNEIRQKSIDEIQAVEEIGYKTLSSPEEPATRR